MLQRQTQLRALHIVTETSQSHSTLYLFVSQWIPIVSNGPTDFRILAGDTIPVREFKAGDVIFNQGDAAEELFIIQSGEVEIRLGNRMLEKLSNYNFFGEMALIDSGPRSATAVAVTDVKLVPIGEKQFLFLVSNTPYFALNVMRILARRLRTTNNTL